MDSGEGRVGSGGAEGLIESEHVCKCGNGAVCRFKNRRKCKCAMCVCTSSNIVDERISIQYFRLLFLAARQRQTATGATGYSDRVQGQLARNQAKRFRHHVSEARDRGQSGAGPCSPAAK